MQKFLIAAALVVSGTIGAAAQDRSVQTIDGASAPSPPMVGASPDSVDNSRSLGVGHFCHFTNGPLAGKQMHLPKPLPLNSECKDDAGDTGKVVMH